MLLFRDVSSVELLMNNHQGIKAEIDARNDSFTTCIELGKALLARKHYASEEVGLVERSCSPMIVSLSLRSPPTLHLSFSISLSLSCSISLPFCLFLSLHLCLSVLSLKVFWFRFQIKEKLLQLTDKRKDMIDKWEDRWEWLRLGEWPMFINGL